MTAEEFLRTKGCNSYVNNGETYFSDVTIHDLIEFSKYHVKQALKEASYKAQAYNKPKFSADINPQVDMESILNAYPLENIK